MTVDSNPVLDEANKTITVVDNIDANDEVSISINGLMALYHEDIEDITGNTITLISQHDLDWTNDSVSVIFTSL